MDFATISLWCLYFIALYFSIFLLTIFLSPNEEKLKKPKKWPSVSVIIPAWNEESTIAETISSALALDYPKDKLKIIVVNHGSTDNTEKIARSFKEVRVLNLKRKKGDNKAVALNFALKYVKTQFFACLDSDSVVDRNALKDMIPYFFTSKKVAVVTPSMLVKSPKSLLQALQKYEYIVAVFFKRLASKINCIYVAPGPFSVYRTEIVKKIGGFSEEAIAEDMEIVYRLQKEHYIVKQCCKGGYSYAEAPKTLKQLYKQRQRWYGGSLENLYKYRNLTLRKKYGDFGFFQMPRNFFGILAAVAAVFFFFYYVIRPILKKVFYFYLIKFDILTYLLNIKFNIDIFTIKDVQLAFVTLFLFLLSIIFFAYACKNVGEKIKFKDLPTIVVFFFFYSLVLSTIYLIVMFKKFTNRKFIWEK